MADVAEGYSSVIEFQPRPIGPGKPPGPPLQPPAGGGTYDGMDGWQTSVEARLGEIKTDVRALRDEARSDFRLLFAAIIAVALGLAGLLAKGFHWL